MQRRRRPVRLIADLVGGAVGTRTLDTNHPTNATRSLLNTAKVMESNAVALRLKELETLEKITEKIGNIFVYGGLDSVLDNLVRMNK